jgi:DNA segregation ATPase FtsK/SpoIIIE-like protein
MSEQNQQEQNQQDLNEEPKKDKGDKVSREAYEKVLTEKKNLAEKARRLEEEKAEIEKQKLKEKEDYKAMYEMTEKSKLELEARLKEVAEKEVKEYKFGALKKEWEKMGLKDSKQAEALFKLSNVEALKFDEEHKVVLGVEEEARRIKETFSPLFGASSTGVAHDAPKGAPSSLTLEQWRQMSPSDKKANEAALYQSLGIKLRK